MNTCYISLGSNLENPLVQVTQATEAISQLGEITLHSSWYHSTAIGPGEQPSYINGVICLVTTLSPLELLKALQTIENRQGRKRTIRWGARTLDLDILLFNDCVISSEELTIPHPRMQERNFVMTPLYEISPDLLFPNQQAIADIMSTLSPQGLEKFHQNG